MFGASWKTTLAGWAAVLTAGGSLLTHVAAGDFSTLMTDITALAAGIGLLFAKDSDVTGGTVRQ